jgi:2-isopropylmalate synthase
VHKGGIHVSAVERAAATYEHIPPEAVGNRRHVLVSELSGKSNLLYKGKEFNIDLSEASDEVRNLLADLKEMENEGFQFEAADGTVEVLLRKALGRHRPAFETHGFRIISGRRTVDAPCTAEAIVKIEVKGEARHTVAEGDGPVNALDNALRKALMDFYPELADVRLTDFKVRVVDAREGTAAKVRVLIESSDGSSEWGTVGVSENIIEAAWMALVDSVEYKLEKPKSRKKAAGKKTGRSARKTSRHPDNN